MEALLQARSATGFLDPSVQDPARHTRFHKLMEFIQDRGIALQLDAEHQLLPFLGGLDALGRELGFRRHEADRGGQDILRDRIENGACLVAEHKLARHIRGQVDRHVNVLEI